MDAIKLSLVLLAGCAFARPSMAEAPGAPVVAFPASELLVGTVGSVVSGGPVRMALSMPGIEYQTAVNPELGATLTGGFLGQLGSEPAEVTTPPIVLSIVEAAPDGFEITWSSVPGANYVLEAADSLPSAAWTAVESANASASTMTVSIQAQSAIRFFRVQRLQ